MPEVISDTSPLQYLHQLSLLHVLPALAGRIVVPTSVGLVPTLRPLLDELQTLRFHVSPQTRSTVLERAGEALP